ncbi:MAG: hypothetical protein ACXVXW_07530 [Mycobacteriaceae bacterium]
MTDRVTADDVTGIDEIVLTGVDVHIEALSNKSFYMSFHRGDGLWIQVEVSAPRKPLTMWISSAENVGSVEIDDEVWR